MISKSHVHKLPAKPVLIFIHGAWHGPEYWTDAVSLLRSQEFHCITPQLDYSGTVRPVDSIATSLDEIQRILIAVVTAGRNVVLVNHSFGGAVGCSSVKGFTWKDPARLHPMSGRVIGIIQLSALMPPSHCSLYDIASLSPDPPFHHHGPDGWEIIDNGDPQTLFYNDLSLEDRECWTSKLKKQSSAAFTDRENIYAGWLDVPIWYLHCTEDLAIPMQVQEAMVSAATKAGADVKTKYIQSGHTPFIGKVVDTVEFINEALVALQT